MGYYTIDSHSHKLTIRESLMNSMNKNEFNQNQLQNEMLTRSTSSGEESVSKSFIVISGIRGVNSDPELI